MQRTMTNEELSKYTGQIKKPTETFKLFLNHYVTGSTWIRSRGDEDTSVWNKLKGEEFETAKKIILDELKIVPDESYMRAVSIFRDERAVPVLMSLIETLAHQDLKLLAAKSLYDLTGCKDYVPMLEDACKNHKDKELYNYLKYSINRFVDGLEETDKLKIMKALDSSSPQ